MSKFCPTIWPEVPVPHSEEGCQDCGLFKHGSRMIWGEGNPKARVMVILDNPGAREDRDGNAFVCGTRQTMQKAAYEVGLSMNDLYVTYILKRRPTRKYDKAKTRHICMKHLKEQLKTVQPSILFCMGNVAVQSFFKDDQVDVKSLRSHWHEVEGFQTTVAYHPLAVRRRPNLWEYFLADFRPVADRLNKIP